MKAVGVLDDNIGIAISWLSIAHCLAMPAINMYAPSIAAHWSHSAHAHIFLAALVIFFGVAAITQDELQNCNLSVRLKMVPGILMVMGASITILLGPEQLEIVTLTVGNLLVIWAHRQNKKLIYAYNAVACVANESMFSQTEHHYS